MSKQSGKFAKSNQKALGPMRRSAHGIKKRQNVILMNIICSYLFLWFSIILFLPLAYAAFSCQRNVLTSDFHRCNCFALEFYEIFVASVSCLFYRRTQLIWKKKKIEKNNDISISLAGWKEATSCAGNLIKSRTSQGFIK